MVLFHSLFFISVPEQLLFKWFSSFGDLFNFSFFFSCLLTDFIRGSASRFGYLKPEIKYIECSVDFVEPFGGREEGTGQKNIAQLFNFITHFVKYMADINECSGLL